MNDKAPVTVRLATVDDVELLDAETDHGDQHQADEEAHHRCAHEEVGRRARHPTQHPRRGEEVRDHEGEGERHCRSTGHAAPQADADDRDGGHDECSPRQIVRDAGLDLVDGDGLRRSRIGRGHRRDAHEAAFRAACRVHGLSASWSAIRDS